MIDGLLIDNFAGGGGASTGIEQAFGRPVDIAINHDAEALALHAANHPQTRHLCEDVWRVDPAAVCAGRPVALAWFSPDCKHFSKAKGGKPVSKKIRGLAWVAVRWAKRVRPTVICLENVEEFQDWGPVGLDGKPCALRKGFTFRRFVDELRRLGYAVDWREMRACDFGAPTIRRRLFLVARRDGVSIGWPAATHGPGLIPYRTAADIIDWSIPCPSIFERKYPLAEATLRRIARGVQRFVIDAAEPFFVTYAQQGGACRSGAVPFHTITASSKDQNCIIAPTLMRHFGQSVGSDIGDPVGTITAGGGGKTALVAAFMAQHNGGPRNENAVGRATDAPLSTLTVRGTQQQLVTSHLIKLRGTARDGQPVTEPLPTVTAGGTHIGEVRAFLLKYYGTDQAPNLRAPLDTVTTKDRFGLVTVAGQDYAIADIGMRMLTPRELFRAQGFPDDYAIEAGPDGAKLTKTAQVRMAGNSVCPPVARAIVEAQFGLRDAAADGPLFGWRAAE